MKIDKILELKKLLDNTRSGLKDSSNTNKTRYAILSLFEEVIEDRDKQLIGIMGDMKLYMMSGTPEEALKEI